MMLPGLDGSHLLGFMAALGVLRLLNEDALGRDMPRPTLAFDASCIAVVESGHESPDAVVDALMAGLESRRLYFSDALGEVDKPADFTHDSFGTAASSAIGWQLYALAGLACSTGVERASESTLCAANGASHQELIRSIRDVLALARRDHVSETAFQPWTKSYEVPSELRRKLNLGTRKPTLRLDPADERLYALRATNPTPSSSEYKTELGAQALAVPAFELLPVCPMRRPICIASRAPPGADRVFFQWCLWSVPATLFSARALLVMGPDDAQASRMRGAFAAFEAARVTGEKGKLSIAPTVGIW